MKFFFYLIAVILCTACYSEIEQTKYDAGLNQTPETIKQNVSDTLTTSINLPIDAVIVGMLEYEHPDPYVYMNEPTVETNNQDIKVMLLQAIQALSENTWLKSNSPVQRLQDKRSLLEKCSLEACDYVPESYKQLSNTAGLINMEYGYNQWMDLDEWYKYAVFDLHNGERVRSTTMFTDPERVLRLLEQRYIKKFQGYLDINKRQTEEDEEAYQLYLEHLQHRVPFELVALDNLELIFNSANELDALHFHYQGQAGYYRDFFPAGAIEIASSELDGLFTPEFLSLLQTQKK